MKLVIEIEHSETDKCFIAGIGGSPQLVHGDTEAEALKEMITFLSSFTVEELELNFFEQV